MTPLKKPVARRANLSRGAIVITLMPPDLITFRYKGGRKTFAMDLNEVFVRAVAKAVTAEKMARRKARRER